MVNEPLTIQIDPASDLARILAAAEESPVVLDSNGVRYTVTRISADVLAGYTPQRARAALERSAGALRGVNTEALKRELREQRAQDSHGRPA